MDEASSLLRRGISPPNLDRAEEVDGRFNAKKKII